MANVVRDFFDNWSTYEASTAKKLRLSLKNTGIKLRTGSACCGNHGEPGC
ncbi:MAG TPA: hypothetical protein VGC47_04410 [Acidimicrobiia bacterium]|jgi:hypothetical protein